MCVYNIDVNNIIMGNRFNLQKLMPAKHFENIEDEVLKTVLNAKIKVYFQKNGL